MTIGNSESDTATQDSAATMEASLPPALPAPLLAFSRACAVGMGVLIGLQLLYAGLLFFGPKPVTVGELAAFTQWGGELYRPERDIPLYIVGSALTVLLCFLLAALDRRRISDAIAPDAAPPAPEHAVALSRCSAYLAFSLAGMALYVPAFYTARSLVLTAHPSPRRAAALLLFPLALEAAGLTFCLRRKRPLRLPLPERILSVGLSRYARAEMRDTPPILNPRRGRLLDVLTPLLLCALIYIPHPERLAGDIFHNEHFHHWDYFVMGPAVGYLHGGALCSQIYAQYGIGLPLLFARLNPYYALGYGHLIQAAMLYACLYFCGVYLFLRRLRLNPYWSTLGVVYLVWLKMFAWSGEWLVVWELPSNTILRAPFDVWFLLLLLLHQQSRRMGWLLLAGALAGLSLLFETDTGIYIAFTFGAYCVLWQPGSYAFNAARSFRSKWNTVAFAWLLAAGVLLSGMAVGSRGAMWHSAFWRGWMECFTAYPAGISMMPVIEHVSGINLSFVFCAVLLSGLAFHLLRRVHPIPPAASGLKPRPDQDLNPGANGDLKPRPDEAASCREDLALVCVALYGTCSLLHFMGRSHPVNLYVAALGFVTILTVFLQRFAAIAQKMLLSARNPKQRKVGFAISDKTAIPLMAAVFVPLYLSNACACNYPNLFRRFLRPYDPHTLALYPNMPDIRLTAADALAAGQYTVVAKEVKEILSEHRTVAIISNDDTSLYLATGAPLWYRYAPMLPSLISRKQLNRVLETLAAKPVDYVFLPSEEPWKSFETWYPLKTADVYAAARKTVRLRYTFDHRCGAYDVWKR